MKKEAKKYIEYINDDILSRIDYGKLQLSYETKDKTYAKGVLNHLHEAMIKIYGDEYFSPNYSNDDFVLIPGVIQQRGSDNLCLALLEFDLSSSGEHLGTDFLCKYGVITQGDNKLSQEINNFMKRYVVYDYCYTATLSCDHHVDYDNLPNAIKDMLFTFHNYAVDLLPSAVPDHDHEPEGQGEGFEP